MLSKVSHTWRERAQRRRQEEQAKRRAIGCAYCKSADDDAQVEGEEGDDVDTHLYTMWELTRGGGCRRVPQSWRSQSKAVVLRHAAAAACARWPQRTSMGASARRCTCIATACAPTPLLCTCPRTRTAA